MQRVQQNMAWRYLWLCAAVSISCAVAVGAEGAAPEKGIKRRFLNAPDTRQTARPGLARLSREPVDVGDFYLRPGGVRTPLLRATGEVCVRYSQGHTAEGGRKALQQKSGTPALERKAPVRSEKRGQPIEIVVPQAKGAALDAKALAESPAVDWAYPVLIDPASRFRMIPSDQILVQLPDGVDAADLQQTFQAFGVTLVRKTNARRLNVHILRLLNPKANDPLSVANALASSGKVLWAEPDFLREIQHQFMPNDPLFPKQQDKHNTGQNGAVVDADVDAPEAWNVTTGTTSVVIAVVDDGADTNHSDIRIFRNPGETGGGKETNGIDDDGNGYVDDWQGWDFINSNNNPNPISTDAHGMGCAGIASAVIGNATGLAGIAGGCQILPVKVAEGEPFASDSVIGEALSYAADFADVISCSWGGGAAASVIDTAISDAVANGRGGKGTPVFCAAGNYASKWNHGGTRARLSLSSYPGTYYIGFCFFRGAQSAGENTVRIDDVCILDGDGYTHKTNILARQNFETSTFPPVGWSHVNDIGTAPWVRESTNAKTGSAGGYSVRAPTTLVSGDYSADLITPLLTLQGDETLAFDYYEATGEDSGFFVDMFTPAKDYVGSIIEIGTYNPTLYASLLYPASLTNTIAVGASTDCNRRSDYSSYGTGLDFTAPSNGGWNDVPSLDPSGSAGWADGDTMMEFGGTSAATPLAAGIGALMLSANPQLTAAQVRSIMRKSCDKIGGVTYSGGDTGAGGWNTYYGYGKINAYLAVTNAIAATLRVVTFNPQGGTVTPTTATVTNGLPYGPLPVPVRAGYTDGGWWTGTNGLGSEITASTLVTLPTNHTVYAKWTANTYTATFVANGGSEPAPTSKSVTFAAAYGPLATTARTGFTFAGWYTNMTFTGGAVTNTTKVVIPGDHNLFAKWTTNTYTVTFSAQGGTTPSPTSKTVSFSAAYGTLATTTRQGYTFDGWYTNAAYTGNAVTSTTAVVIASNHTLFAKWVPKSYTVTFAAQGGATPVPASNTVTFASSYGTVATTVRTGYTFSGWYTNTTYTGSQVTNETLVTIPGNHSLYAKWTANVYTVTFEPQGGVTPSPASKSVTFASTYGTLATTTRPGYTFGGWYTNAAYTGSQITSTTAVTLPVNHSLYAKWTANAYTVTFAAQGGTTPSPASKSVTFGSPYGALATTTRAGNILLGWYTNTTYTGSQVTTSTVVNIPANHSLYAKWTTNTYAVTFSAQGGSAPVPASKNVTYGSTYGTLATTARTGYTFAGWYTNDTYAGSPVTNATAVTIPITHTLFAKWTTNTYTVTFSAQGGTAPVPPSKSVTFDAAYGALATTARAGYAFAGWYTNDTYAGSPVTDATPVTTPTNHTLFAKWTIAATARGTPVAWLDLFGLAGDGNYELADTADADGDGLAAWQEYVAGTVPTNKASVFLTTLLDMGGQRQVHWVPDLTGAVPARVYSVYGTASLLYGFQPVPLTNIPAGTPIPVQALSTNRFFKIGVSFQP